VRRAGPWILVAGFVACLLLWRHMAVLVPVLFCLGVAFGLTPRQRGGPAG
jgi:hypothetical protein